MPESGIAEGKVDLFSTSCYTEVFQFYVVLLLIVILSACAISVLFRKSFPVPGSSGPFSSIRFSVFGVIVKTLIY